MVTLSRRFAAAFILIVALPTLGVSVALARLYLSALHETVAQQAEVTAEQVAENIRTGTDDVALLAAALAHDEELRELAGTYATAADRRERYVASRRLDDKLVSFFRYTKQVGAVVLFLEGGATYAYSNYPNLRGVSSIDRSVWAEAAVDPGKVVLLDTLEGVTRNIGAKNMINLAVCPAPRGEGAIEAILVMFRVPYLDALLARWDDDPSAAVVMFGRSGKPLLSSLAAPEASSDMAALLRASPPRPGAAREVRSAGRTWLATAYPVSSTGWTLLLLSDQAALSRRVTRYQWYLYPALGLLGILFLLYAEIFFARIAVPIRAVVRHMGSVGKGDLAVRARPQRIAELAELTHGFNTMVQQVEQLRVERERSERERLAVELDALRYQINPHFVANTLNSIRLMALAARADAIAGMTRDLMRLLADSYSGAEKLTDLSRELDNVRAYVGIMKLRFGEQFAVEYALDPGTEALLALRMILQPIVENAILHGFSGGSTGGGSRLHARPQTGPGRAGSSSGLIRISARLEPRALPVPRCPEAWARAVPGQVLVVEVRDDGAGMSPEQVGRLLEGPPGRDGLHRIGLANVQRRIRLHFGEPYGLEVESEAGRFTVVRYLLPALERAQEAEVLRA